MEILAYCSSYNYSDMVKLMDCNLNDLMSFLNNSKIAEKVKAWHTKPML